MAFARMPQAPGGDARVRYENAGANAKTVLADISALAHMRLEAAPETAAEILCVSFTDDPIQDVMNRLAWAVDGKWKSTDAGFRLIRTPEQQAAERQSYLKARIAAYQTSMDHQRRAIESEPDFSPDLANAMARFYWPPDGQTGNRPPLTAGGQAPMMRAVERIAMLFDPSDLATLPANGKAVYASRPTSMQRPLSDAQLEVLRQLVREEAIWSDAVKRAKSANPDYRNQTYGVYSDAFTESQIGDVLVTITKFADDFGPVQLSVILADRAGRNVVHTMFTLGADRWTNAPHPTHAPLPAGKVTLPADLVEMQSEVSPQPPHGTLPAADVDILTHPENQDPLGATVGQILLLIAKASHRPLVADMADEWARRLPPPAQQIDPNSFLFGLEPLYAERNNTAAWIGLRPALPGRERPLRADRLALGRFLRRCAQGPPSLDEQAQFCLSMADPNMNPLPYNLAAAITRERWSIDPEYLRFYAQLTPDEKRAALGDGVRVGDIPATAWSTLSDLVFATRINLTENRAPNAREGPTSPPFYESVFSEPTMCMPDGLLPDGIFQLTDKSGEAVRLAAVDGRGMTSYGPEEFAWARFRQTHPYYFRPPGDPGAPEPSLSRVIYGARSNVAMHFQLTPVVSLYYSFQTASFGGNGELSYKDLPEAFQKEVDRVYAQLTENYKYMAPPPGFTSGRTSPPP